MSSYSQTPSERRRKAFAESPPHSTGLLRCTHSCVGSALPGHSRSRETWDVAGAVRRARNHLTQGIACRAEPPPHTTPLLRQMWPLWSAARHAPLQALAAPSRTGEARLEGPTHAQTRMIDAICAAQVHMSPPTPLAAMMPPCSLQAHPFCRLFGLVHFCLP